ncbi:hypothetical protein [Natrononativus amylolyticus]|uniref:hypothetical protein n=1 Tax=Natrononativus amylolyticus TaxID=2963434 RepID=UPI0020CDA694|nr:hypothetical protein [Natrononativus amylolyticus]
MGKVSIGMLGWRFDEDDILDENGEFRPLEEMPKNDRERLIRLQSTLYNAPCNACWLIHGDANLEECNTARYVYGEPLSEVVLCEEHEPDFVYWFRRDGGGEYQGEEEFEDRFYEWFLEGGRAPEGYEGMEYVSTDPDDLPKPPKPDPDEYEELMDDDVSDRVGLTEEEIRDSGVDLGSEYPSK